MSVAVYFPFATELGVVSLVGDEPAHVLQGIAEENARFMRETAAFCKACGKTVQQGRYVLAVLITELLQK